MLSSEGAVEEHIRCSESAAMVSMFNPHNPYLSLFSTYIPVIFIVTKTSVLAMILDPASVNGIPDVTAELDDGG